MRTHMRVFLLTLLVCVFGITLCYAETIWEKRQKAIKGIEEKQEEAVEEALPEAAVEPIETEEVAASNSPIPLNEITIPDQYGSIIETHEGTNGKLIVHIQDAHCNYEGQMNEAKILESLIEDCDLSLILSEGKLTDRDFKYIRPWLPTERRKKVADGLVKDGYITGVDYLDLSTDYPFINQGIEDKRLYDSNRNALWEIDKFKDLAAEYIDKLIKVSDAVKLKIYNQDLLAMDNKKKDYDAEKIDLLTYYEYLYKTGEAKEMSLYTFPNFENLIKASELEKKIDLAKIRGGSATEEERKLYDDYLEATRNLNVNSLFKEEPLLEGMLWDILAENSDQKNLVRISKALSIMGNLLKIKVVPEEYKYFTDKKKDFDPKLWADFLKQKVEELNISVDIPENYYIISDNLPKIEQFYNIAMERERVFLRRMEEHLQKDNVKLAALVAGGFHTPTLTKLLADAGYSYIVVSPKVTTGTDDNLYRWALKMEWIPELK